jgi:hypothetical protein
MPEQEQRPNLNMLFKRPNRNNVESGVVSAPMEVWWVVLVGRGTVSAPMEVRWVTEATAARGLSGGSRIVSPLSPRDGQALSCFLFCGFFFLTPMAMTIYSTHIKKWTRRTRLG